MWNDLNVDNVLSATRKEKKNQCMKGCRVKLRSGQVVQKYEKVKDILVLIGNSLIFLIVRLWRKLRQRFELQRNIWIKFWTSLFQKLYRWSEISRRFLASPHRRIVVNVLSWQTCSLCKLSGSSSARNSTHLRDVHTKSSAQICPVSSNVSSMSSFDTNSKELIG